MPLGVDPELQNETIETSSWLSGVVFQVIWKKNPAEFAVLGT